MTFLPFPGDWACLLFLALPNRDVGRGGFFSAQKILVVAPQPQFLHLPSVFVGVPNVSLALQTPEEKTRLSGAGLMVIDRAATQPSAEHHYVIATDTGLQVSNSSLKSILLVSPSRFLKAFLMYSILLSEIQLRHHYHPEE